MIVSLVLRIKTYEMYSFSFFVTRTSGSLPKRPIRVSFATSELRVALDENALKILMNLSQNTQINSETETYTGNRQE